LLLLAARSVVQATLIPPVAPLMLLVLIAMLRRAMAETGGMRHRTRWRQNKIKLSCSAD